MQQQQQAKIKITTCNAFHSMLRIPFRVTFIKYVIIIPSLTHSLFPSIHTTRLLFLRIIIIITRGEMEKTKNFLIFFTDDPLDTEILATAPKPGTSLRTATAIKAGQRTASSRPRTSTGRPLTGLARPGTMQQRAGTSSLTGNRTALQTGRLNTARNIRLGSASIFNLNDNTFNMSRLNPAIFATKPAIAKILFQFLYYCEGDIKKALDLCNAVMDLNKTEAGWYWYTQKGKFNFIKIILRIRTLLVFDFNQFLEIFFNLFKNYLKITTEHKILMRRQKRFPAYYL